MSARHAYGPTAQFEGRCASCWKPIRVGAAIHKLAGHWLHIDCDAAAYPPHAATSEASNVYHVVIAGDTGPRTICGLNLLRSEQPIKLDYRVGDRTACWNCQLGGRLNVERFRDE